MNLLIPGGAGYIGSHMVKLAQEQGHEVVVLDNFSTGHRWSISDCEILEVDLLDENKLSKLLKGRAFDGVIHFAAKSLVSESFLKPDLYYKNNVTGTLNLIKTMIDNNISNIVFSSTAAIFGNPKIKKIKECHKKSPINPYGKSKLMVENMLEDFAKAYELNVTCLRYFNAAGAHCDSNIGEDHEPETHLIPNVIKSTINEREKLKVFGNTYNTHDGTCIRDYVHVTDLASAHLLALKMMKKHYGMFQYNLGNSDGFSVMDIIKSCEKIIKTKISYTIEPPREGDPSSLIADSSLAKENLGWNTKHSDIDNIIKTAYEWHKKQNFITNKN